MKHFVLSVISLFTITNLWAQADFDVYISNKGNDMNSGNKPALPKKTINGAFAHPGSINLSGKPVRIGLEAGNLFSETFNSPYPLHVGTYSGTLSNTGFTIFNGTSIFDTGWVRTETRNNLFEQKIPLTGFTGYGINGVGQYSFVYVFEIDRALEKTSPFTARKLLKFVKSLGAADAIPGSFYEPATENINPKKIYIHTSDGVTPNQHPKYRYEVTVRDRAFNVTYQEQNHFENLWIRGYGAGNGMIPAGANSSFNRMIFGPGAGIHHLVLRGGNQINNTLFLPSAKNVTQYAVVFYDVEGFKTHNTIRNSIFIDIPDPVYTHNSYGSNFGALEFDNVLAFGDSTDAGNFVQSANTDSILLKNSYSYQYKSAYSNCWAAYTNISSCGFIDVLNGLSFTKTKALAAVANTFIKTNGASVNGIILADSMQLSFASSIVHLRTNGVANNSIAGSFISRAGIKGNQLNAVNNIFICDVDPSKSVLAATVNTSKGAATTTDRWQNNVYVLLRGDKLLWRVTDTATNNGNNDILSFEDWKKQSGQDKNSLFFDLRNDPRGLKAIFSDPEKGDYELANTIEGNKIRALKAGMTKPISCFVKKPTYEEAAALIMNNRVVTADVCRSPCVQNNIRGGSQVELQKLTGNRIQVKWNLDDERGVDHYEVLRSFGSNDFVSIQSLLPKGDSVYSFTDSLLQPGIEYRYSIAVLSKFGGKCYSDIRITTTDGLKKYSLYPNPSSGKINLRLSNYSGMVKLTVTNVLGRLVYSKKMNVFYGILPMLDFSLQAKGIYWAKIETDTGTSVQSFLLH